MFCNIEFLNSALGKAIKKKARTNKDTMSYITTMHSIGFRAWYRDNRSGKLDFDVEDPVIINELVKDVIAYHANHVSAKVTDTVSKVDIATATSFLQLYTDVSAREFAKNHIAQLILEIERDGKLKNSSNKIKDYRGAVLRKYLSIAASRIATRAIENDTEFQNLLNGKSVIERNIAIAEKHKILTEGAYVYLTDKISDTVKNNNIPLANQRKAIAALRYQYISKTLGTQDGDTMTASEQDANLAALIYEFTSTPSLFAEVIDRNGNVNKLFIKDKTFGEIADIARLDEASVLENDKNQEVDITESGYDKDMSYIVYDSHSGFYSNYDAHVDEDVRTYLSTITQTLPIRDSADNVVVADINNPLGVQVNMDYHNIVNFLFTSTAKTSYDAFVRSIQTQIASRPRFSGLQQLVADITENPSLGAKLFRIFSKNVMPKIQLSSNDKSDIVTISNSRTDLRTCLYYEFSNAFKTTALIYNTENFPDIMSDISDAKNLGEDSLAKSKMIKAFTQLFPSIDTYGLHLAIEEDYDGMYNNLNSFYHIATEYYKEYLDREAQIEALRKKSKPDYGVINALRNAGYNTQIEFNIDNFVKSFSNYCVVKIDLNSANVLGNKSSDIGNDNWITSRINVLQDYTALQAWGDYISQSTQFDKNPLLFSQFDDNGNQISTGIFYYDKNGKVRPSENASDLIRFYLFDGAENENTKDGVMYATMTNSDYTVSAYKMFFNDIYTIKNEKDDKDYAPYFLRTPADAPRNYNARSVRHRVVPKNVSIEYDEEGEIKQTAKAPLFVPSGVKIVRNKINSRLFGINVSQTGYSAYLPFIESKGLTVKGVPLSAENAVKYFMNGVERIYSPSSIFDTNDRSKKIKKYSYDTMDIYVLFDYKNNGGVDVFSNPVVLQVRSNNAIVRDASQLPKEVVNGIIQNSIENGTEGVTEAINRNHPIFKLLYNSVIQELTDAATALDVIFKTESDGRIRPDFETGKLPFRKDFNEHSDDNDNLFRTYHLDKDDNGKWTLFNRNENGEIESLAGRVFKFDNLTVDDFSLDDVIKNVVTLLPISSTGELTYDSNYLRTTTDSNGRFTVTLTPYQKEVISKGIEIFINRLTERKLNELKSKEKFIGKEATRDEAAELALNYFITYLGFDGMLEGNPKFYKNMDDFIKRAKEVQAGGIPYFLKNLFTYAQQNSKTEVDANNDPLVKKDWGIRLKPYFNAVTIVNTIQTHHKVIEDLSKSLDEAYKEEGYSKEQREKKIARQFENGYHNTKVNDAQSYITFEEWVRRITQRGQLEEYTPLIEAILDETKPVDTTTLEKFVQVQKNYYFDFGYNDGNKVMAPRQIKNAEFVLVPRFIRGTELELVYETMKENKIDQLNTVETSKASNTNVLELFDAETGQLTQEKLYAFKKAIEAPNVISKYDYSYLYTQQETPQHMNADNKLGTQFVKRIADAVPERLQHLKEKLFDIESVNIATSAEDLMTDLQIQMSKDGSIKLDGNGNIETIDVKRLLDMLKDDGRRSGLNSNQLEYFQLIDELEKELKYGNTDATLAQKTVMPLYMSSISAKAQSMLQSLFNNHITRQLMHGYHAVQVTDVGWRKYKRNEGGFISDPNDNLKYHKDGVDYIEVKVPRSAFNFDEKKIARWQSTGLDEAEVIAYKTDIAAGVPLSEDEVNSLLLIEIQKAGLDNHIIYRIPTEGQQSMAIAKIVGFTNPAYGSCIIVPNEWVAQTGADFDIDTIYAMTHSTRINKTTGMIEKLPFINDTEHDRQLYIDYVKNRVATIGHFAAERDAIKKRKNSAKKILTQLKAKQAEYKAATDADVRKKIGAEINELNIAFAGVQVDDSYYFNLGNDNSWFDTFEDFSAKDAYRKNSIEARNNVLLDTIMELLSDMSSVEKQTFRSNFDDISKVKKELISESEKTARKQRNVHNFDDVAAYQSELASGRAIKGISVMLDNCASILGSVQATLPVNVEILYDTVDEDETNRSVEYTTNADGTTIINHRRIGWSKNQRNIEGLPLLPYSSETTAYMLDIGKEGALTNVNIETFDVFKLFSMIGSTYSAAISFMGLPGVSEIVKVIESNNSIFAVGHRNEIDQAIINIAKKYNFQVSKYDNKGTESVEDTTPPSRIIRELNAEKLFKVTMPHIKNYKAPNGQDYLEGVPNPTMFDGLIKPADLGSKFPVNVGRNKNAVKQIEEFAIGASSPVEGMSRDEFDMYYELATVFKYAHLKQLGSMLMNVANKINPDSFGAKATLYANNKVFDDIFDAFTNGALLPMVGNKNIYEAIYPGLLDSFDENGLNNAQILSERQRAIDNFISTDRGKESKYKPLYYFLKCSTGTSQKVSRIFLPTQNIEFRHMVNRIKEVFTAGKRMDEATYNNVENFFINHIYHDTMLVSSSLTIDKNTGEVMGMRLNSMNENIDESLKGKTAIQLDDEARLRESRRITGYNYSPDLLFVDKNGDYKQFTVKDINNPTQDEIDNFAELTPAQKITWIKIHFPANAGIFEYIETSLSNTNASYYLNNYQTISCFENNINIEFLFREFNDSFNNDNPLLKLAVLDAMKYAFVMEGFRNRRHSITQILTNNILKNTTPDVNMVDEIRRGMNQLVDMTTEEAEAVLHAYVRANAFSMKQISEFELNKRNGVYDLIGENTIGKSGIVKLPALHRYKDESGNDITHKILGKLAHYNIIHYVPTDKTDPNAIEYEPDRYVKFKTGKVRTLYKIVALNTGTYLIPINLLESTENPTNEWSINPRNNRFAPYDVLMSIVMDIEENEKSVTAENVNEWNQIIDDAKHTEFSANARIKTIKLDNGVSSQIKPLLSKLKTTKEIYFRNENLVKELEDGKYKAVRFTITENNEVKTYVAFKTDLSKYVEQFKIQGLSFKSDRVDPTLSKFLNELKKNYPNANLDDVFLLSEYVNLTDLKNPSEEASPLSLAGMTFAKGAYAQSELALDDDDNKSVAKVIRDITRYQLTDELEILQNPTRAYNTFTKYAEDRAKTIVEKMNGFTQVLSTGEVVKADDEQLAGLMLGDVALADRFEKFVVSTCYFLNSVKDIINLHPDDINTDLKPYIERIKNVVSTISQERIDKMITNYVNIYLQSQSGNPLYGTNNVTGKPILDIRNGFYRTSFMEKWIGDVQESPNPIIQVGVSYIEEKLKEYEVKGVRKSKEWFDKYDKIVDAAAKAGVPINIDHIVDENGNLYNPYTEQFIQDYQTLSDNLANAAKDHGTYSMEYLEAEIALKQFKLDHIEQPVVEFYYMTELRYKEVMLNKMKKSNKVKVAYERYFKLSEERNSIFNELKQHGTTVQNVRLAEIRQELKEIRQEYEEDPIDGTLRLSQAADAINTYVNGLRSNDTGYVDKKTNTLFQEQLAKNLQIVLDFEEANKENDELWFENQRLRNDNEYATAYNWLEYNAEYIVNEEVYEKVSKAYAALSKGVAVENRAHVARGHRTRAIRDILKAANAFDERGIPDGRKLTSEQLNGIRSLDAINYQSKTGGEMADNTILGNRYSDNIIYVPDVYQHLSDNADVVNANTWRKTAYKINSILKRARVKNANTKKIEINPAILSLEDLKELDRLFTILESCKKNTDSSDAVKDYISKNFASVTYNDLAEEHLHKAESEFKGTEYIEALKKVLYRPSRRKAKGSSNPNEVNSWLYSELIIMPGKEALIDRVRTDAVKILNEYTKRKPNKYYFMALRKVQATGNQTLIDEWFAANTIYNPYTHELEPLSCWTETGFKEFGYVDDGNGNKVLVEGAKRTPDNYKPTWMQQEKTFKDDVLNPYYSEKGLRYNYKKGSAYDNQNNKTSYEQQLEDLMVDTLTEQAHSHAAKTFFEKGKLPYRNKTEHTTAQKALNFIGLNATTPNEKWITDQEIDMSINQAAAMPYLHDLRWNEETKPEDYNDERDRKIYKDKGKEDEYDALLKKKAEDYNKKAKEHNERIVVDKDVRAIIGDFIRKAHEYNAIYDNAAKLFIIQKELQQYKVYAYNRGAKFLPKRRRGVETPDYAMMTDTNALDQWNNFIRRIYYRVYKEDHGYISQAAAMWQNFTSAKFMMMNIHGGIANVTVGLSGMIAEAGGAEHFNSKSLLQGMNFYIANTHRYIHGFGEVNPINSLQLQLIILFNVVDYDAFRQTVSRPGMEEHWARAKDIAYTPQTMGEHFMQNSVLFAMMFDNVIVERPTYVSGRSKYIAMSRNEYIANTYIKAMKTFLSPEKFSEFEMYIEQIKAKPERLREFALFQDDFIANFLRTHCTIDEMKQFAAIRSNLEKQAIEDYKKEETVMSQYTLDDNGKLTLRADSKLGMAGENEQDMFVGHFSQKVISVNKKIHGVYDKLGSAMIEKTLLGGCVMQYHKHLWPGILKRYRIDGMYNESRRSIERGWVQSLYRFLSIPIRENLKGYPEDTVTTLENIQRMFGNITYFVANMRTYYNTLSPKDQANIRAWLADWAGIVGAVAMGALLYAIGAADDDDDEGWIANIKGLGLYEANRLFSENVMWGPVGAMSEAKTLWSSPIAAQSIGEDLIDTMGFVTEFLFNDDFEVTYKTGAHAGENKFAVKLMNEVPLYRTINRLFYMNKSNKYYRIGDKNVVFRYLKNTFDDED